MVPENSLHFTVHRPALEAVSTTAVRGNDPPVEKKDNQNVVQNGFENIANYNVQFASCVHALLVEVLWYIGVFTVLSR